MSDELTIIKQLTSRIVTLSSNARMICQDFVPMQPSSADLHLTRVRVSKLQARRKERLKWLAILVIGFSLIQLDAYFQFLPKAFELADLKLSQLTSLFG